MKGRIAAIIVFLLFIFIFYFSKSGLSRCVLSNDC